MGFAARTSTAITPDMVPVETYGEHSSTVVTTSSGLIIRQWTFESQAGRDAFIRAISEGKFRRGRN